MGDGLGRTSAALSPKGLIGRLHRRARIALTKIGPHGGTAFVLLVYGCLSVAMTWPLAARLTTHIPAGVGGDVWVHQWTLWWLKTCVTQGLDPFHTDLLFYPVGVSLTSHNIAWVNFALWLPLQAVFGNHAAYGLMYIGLFALNGLAMYLLTREWTGSPAAAFVGGLVYGFWPYVLSQSGHPNTIVILWLPLALLFLRRTIDKRRVRDAAWAALFVALVGISRWQLLVPAGVILGLYVLCRALTDAASRTWRTARLLALSGLLSVALMAPLAVPMVIDQVTGAHPEDLLIDDSAKESTDLLAYVLPNANLYLWGHAVPLLGPRLQFTSDRVDFIGYTTLLLALYGMVRQWSKARFWALAAAAYVALGLGPQLHLGSQLYPQVPMPYRLVEDLFFVRLLRAPHRFNIYLGLPMAMLVTWGVQALLRQRFLGRAPGLVLGVAGALILGETCLVPYRIEQPVTPEWYRELVRESGRFAVLDLPMGTRSYDKRYMLYQMTHGKPLVEGHVSRNARDDFAFLESTPFLQRLHSDNVMEPALSDVTHQLRTLAEAGVRYLILHKRFVSPDQLAAWQDWLTFAPYHEDADLVVYRTQPEVGRDIDIAQQVTDEIGLIRATFTPTEMTPIDAIQVDIRWASRGAPDRDYDACLSLIDPQGRVAQSDCQILLPTWPTASWGAGEVARSNYRLWVNPSLEQGTYTLSLSLVEHATDTRAGHAVDMGLVQIKPPPWIDDPAGQAHASDARFGDALRLLAYRVEQDNDRLALTLSWRAERSMDVDYKVFVHVADPATAIPVAQDDAMPVQWRYPTTRWAPGEIVVDTISISLQDAPTGTYELALGVYNPASGERLPIVDGDGAPQVDGRLVLRGEEIRIAEPGP
jgi:hypothetical protein